MRIAMVQQHARPDRHENVARGIHAFEAAARGGAQVIGFAELAFEPFYPQNPAEPESLGEAETVPGPITDAFAARARELGVVCVLNLFERDGTRTFDCSPVIDADGSLLGRTRMIHIVFAGESFVCGPDGTVITRAAAGSDEILYAEIDLTLNAQSHARRLFLRDRRPELYGEWAGRSSDPQMLKS